jgi:hypothetical protein
MKWDQRKQWFLFRAGGAPHICTPALHLQAATPCCQVGSTFYLMRASGLLVSTRLVCSAARWLAQVFERLPLCGGTAYSCVGACTRIKNETRYPPYLMRVFLIRGSLIRIYSIRGTRPGA